ncbi:hypothetical protein [Sutcliffiella sp. FSL R7-0096]|uniref:hypothetical protein n=1 Tax=Sutcliffiella sp. FSL R7-0096 TaxID=2921670 RepID=UPI00315A0C37
MAYKESIAREIRQLIKDAPEGNTEYCLEHYDQQDVADTVNSLHYEYPRLIQETDVYYTGTAPIVIMK